MRRVATEELAPGDRIGKDVLAHTAALPLLRAGVRVSESLKASLLRVGIASVWIDDDLSAGIEPPEVLREETRQRAVTAIRSAFLDPSQRLAKAPTIGERALAEMTQVIDLMIEDVSSNAHVAVALNDLANADAYTLKHSLSVATLGLALGYRVLRKFGWVDLTGKRRLDSITARMPALGLGLMLHDIGKLAIPHEILHKAGPLTEAELAIMRTHPQIGVQMLQRAEISPLTRAVVREHHERWNGSGYPDGKVGDASHQFSRIAAVADVFDALTSDRVYRDGDPIHQVYQYMVDRSGTDFDPEVIAVFRSTVAPYPVGTNVVLSDGAFAIVSAVREEAVSTPTVRVLADRNGAAVAPREVDLSRTPGLTIATVCEQDPFQALRSSAR